MKVKNLFLSLLESLSHLPLNFLSHFVTSFSYFATPFLYKEKQYIANTVERVYTRLKTPLPLPSSKIANKCITHFSLVIAEYLKMPSFKPKDYITSVEFIGLENLTKAIKEYKSAIIVVPHIGNWEILGGALAHLGYELHSFFLLQKYNFMSEMLSYFRKSTNMKFHDRDRELLSALKATKQGAIIGMMPDQDGGNHGIFTDFLGHWVSLPIGPANWSIKLSIPIVAIFCLRIKNTHKFVAYCYKPLDQHIKNFHLSNTSSSSVNNKIIELTIQIKKWMEQVILRYPTQYLWFYDRFKPRHHEYIAKLKKLGYHFVENQPFFYKSKPSL